MAQWRKVIVSGSAAELSSLTLDTALPVAQGGIGASSLSDKAVLISQDSGTDAVGALALTTNGSIVVGGTNGPAVEAAADVAGTGLTAVTGDGTLVINVDASQTQITSVGALDAGSITSNFGSINNGSSAITTTGTITGGSLINDSTVAASRITGSFTGSFVGDGSSLTGVAQDIDSLSEFSSTSFHQTQDMFHFSDNGTEKKVNFSNLQDGIFADVSGDATIAAGGALTIAATSVENGMLAGSIANAKLSNSTISGVSLGSNLNDLTVDDTTIQLNSGTTFNGSAARTISAKTAAIADGGAALATADQIHTFYTTGGSDLATALNTDLGGDFTIGNQSSDTATFSGAVMVEGNLTIKGTQTSQNVTNLLVEDKFILLNSGSAAGDGGIVVQTHSGYSGSALFYDDSASRWGLTKADDTAQSATSATPRQYIVSVSGSTEPPVVGSNPQDFGGAAGNRIGMMHIETDTGDIYIWS